MAVELKQKTRGSACPHCTATRELIMVEGAAEDTFKPCRNCGFGASELEPVTDEELSEAAEWIKTHTGYERPIVVQRLYHLLWLAMRARGSQPTLVCLKCVAVRTGLQRLLEVLESEEVPQ